MATTQKTPVWKGTKEIAEQPGYPRIKVDSNGTSITRRYEGAFEKIQAEITSARIATGKAMPNLGAGYSSVRIRTFESWPAEGDSGVLIVQMDDFADGGSSSSGSTVGAASYEDDWVVLEKSIERHPRYADVSDADIIIIREAVENPVSGQSPFLTDTAAIELYTKLLRGQDSYTLYSPIVRSTTPYDGPPPQGKAGQLENPPGNAPADWDWRKTAYRRQKPGSQSAWDLVEEWTGADQWDPDIYGSQAE